MATASAPRTIDPAFEAQLLDSIERWTDRELKPIARRHDISPRRSASLLDIFACVTQGVLPYGAQILLAASLDSISPLALAGKVHYCWLLALSAVLFMLWPTRRNTAVAAEPG